MTPKEKAKELVDKFLNFVREKNFFGDNEEFKNAKQCALIAVDELIKEVNHSDVYYWQEVKQEIELL